MTGPTFHSAVAFAAEYSRRGKRLDVVTKWRVSNLAKARNEAVREALATGAERILLLDSDIVFTPVDVFALIDAEEDVVSGLYVHRAMSSGPDVAELVGYHAPEAERRGALVEMQHIGLGFTLIRRRVLEALLNRYADGIFEFVHSGDHVIGEDQVFSKKWRDMGGRIWMHTGVCLGHVGLHIFR